MRGYKRDGRICMIMIDDHCTDLGWGESPRPPGILAE